MKNNFAIKATQIYNRTALKVKKYSPEILLAAGIIGSITGTVLACKATTKAKEILKQKDEMLDTIHQVQEDEEMSKKYSEKDYSKDLTMVYTQTGMKLLGVYGPAISVSLASFACIICGHKILQKRLIGVSAAYAIVDQSFKKYRANVVEKFGKDTDEELRYGIKYKEIIKKDKNGKEVKEIGEFIDFDENLEGGSDYSRFFDATSKNFERDPEYNLMFLRRQQDYANEMLKSRGHLFLNEVYDLLDIQRSKAGQVVGWIYDTKNPKGDNYVDFGIYRNNESNRRFVNGLEQNVLLDFNVDGVIYDKI